jgi:hypothetical protein
MKPGYLFIILLFNAILISCNKDMPSPTQTNGKVLQGVWELRAMNGGMLVYDPNHFKPGNGNLWAFGLTTFERIYKDSVYRRGTYSISRGTGSDLNTGRKIDQFIFNNEPAESFELRNDTLRVYYGAIPSDGGIEMFVKIAD